MNHKNSLNTKGYSVRRYFTPSSLLASQTTKKGKKRAARRRMSTTITYQQLLENQEIQVQLGNLNKQTAANRATALRRFMKAHSLHPDDVVGDEMRIQYPDALGHYMNTLRLEGKSSRAITNTKAAMRPWKEAVVEFDTQQALLAEKPTPFIQSLVSLIGETPVTHVAKQAGIPRDMLFGWLAGKTPRSSSASYVKRLEGFFGVERDLLTQLSGMKLTGVRQFIGGEAAPIEYRNQFGKLTRTLYGIKPNEDSPLRQQWTEFLTYKTAVAPLYKRTKRGKWRFSPCPLTAVTPANWWAFLDGREVASARTGWQNTGTYLGWLKIDSNLGGGGYSESEVHTMAWLAVPDYLEKYLSWRTERAGKRNQGFMQFLSFVAALVRPRYGYLRQRPEMQQTLPARFHEESWDSLCERQFELVEQIISAYFYEIEVSRDSFEPIKHIIESSSPMQAMADMVQRLRADRPIGGNKRREAIWSRNLVLIKLLLSNPLRKRNLAHLTWKADNTGNLYQRVDGSWWIKIPKGQFKNSHGAAGDCDYDSPVHPSVWRDIERYITQHRPHLMVASTDLFFLTMKAPGATEHRPWIELGQAVSALTSKYLIRCQGVGPHAFRHLVATSILKADGGDYKTAAQVLNDRVHTVEKHYAHLRSGDGANRMAELLESSFSRM